ncbi:hypothetical protein NO995_07665 [Aestuariibaculum sp. M13]|uniref:hypothetical protein n=1 Tax=Aestuariibaculum sp. M13 TaxID=2967132 RepID=UPI002159E835|nr:hypothetical protein [Aestuariibaculum sp. M13]MCR8667553.1 hypothetical protein [Aestuariibaculum sp. M13]
MKTILSLIGIVLLVVSFSFGTENRTNGDINLTDLVGINTANAECEVEVKIGIFWKTVLKCDDTPNETCTFEHTDEDTGETTTFSCSGKQTYIYQP